MRYVLPILGCLAVATSAAAAQDVRQNVRPPKKYDHPYTAGPVEVIVAENNTDLRARCGHVPRNALACAMPPTADTKTCTIIITQEDGIQAEGYAPADVLRHEMGHCNGWPADHPGARPVRWPVWHTDKAARR
jgi:hypothetical protein